MFMKKYSFKRRRWNKSMEKKEIDTFVLW
jgi:hypothetical protein